MVRIVLFQCLGERSDKNQRNFENFAQKFSPLGRIRTLLPLEHDKIFGARATRRDTPWMWQQDWNCGGPIYFRPFGQEIDFRNGPSDLKTSDFYPNALLGLLHEEHGYHFQPHPVRPVQADHVDPRPPRHLPGWPCSAAPCGSMADGTVAEVVSLASFRRGDDTSLSILVVDYTHTCSYVY